VSIRVTLDQKQIKFLTTDRRGSVGRYLIRRAIFVTAKAKSQVNSRTGALRKSIGWTFGVGLLGPNVRIGSDLSYARLHHEGSRPHVITPNKRQALKFSSKGAVIFAQRVLHPGTKPNRYLTDNLRWFRT
jgi:hypothetical protein